MNLYTVKNNETGETKGLDLKATVDMIYFDAVAQGIKDYPEEYSEFDHAELMRVADIGLYRDLQEMIEDLGEPHTFGRYTVTPIN